MATGISKIYLKHFVKNIDSRWTILQGSRRSGKSWAVHRWLWFLASGKPKIVGIICASFPALRNCISDFQRATGLQVTGSSVYGFSCNLTNGSKFLFRSFDEPTKAQGTTFDIVYLEEALNIDETIVTTLSMSVTGQIFAAFNPTKKSYLDKYVNEDRSNILVTTFKDNPYLTQDQIAEFEKIKERALRPAASILDRYAYEVYYKGNFSEMSGKVFKLIYRITDDEYAKIQANEMFGIDFGFVASEQSDATALVGCKIWNNCVYYKQYIYSNMLANNKELALKMAECGLDVYSPIAADYGGLGKTRIHALVTAEDGTWTEPSISSGFSVQNAVKGKIIDGLSKMNQFDKIYVTDSSVELREEFDNYELGAEGKPKSGSIDHGIDAARYATNSYSFNFD